MKKLIITFLMLVPACQGAIRQIDRQFGLPTVCDRQYALDNKAIITKLSGFNKPSTLKEYQDFMVIVKEFEDFSFKIHALETQVSTVALAYLRTPLNKYNVCRNQRVVLRGTVTASDCDATYLIYMDRALKQLEKTNDPQTIEVFKDHMVRLKNLEDIRFKIQAFEHKKINLPMIGTLRAPVARYLNCRDTILRTFAR